MSAHSVEEIIGKGIATREGWRGATATADDMLAWLRAKYGRLSMTAWALDAERPFVVAIECGPSGAPHIEQSGPTLHAALEAVVRAAAGSS